MGCHFLLQRIFLTQGSNLHLLRWQADSLPPSHLGRACRLPSSGEPWVGSEPWGPRRKQGPGEELTALSLRLGPQPVHTILPTPELLSHLLVGFGSSPRKKPALRPAPFTLPCFGFSPRSCTAGGRCGAHSKPTTRAGRGFSAWLTSGR